MYKRTLKYPICCSRALMLFFKSMYFHFHEACEIYLAIAQKSAYLLLQYNATCFPMMLGMCYQSMCDDVVIIARTSCVGPVRRWLKLSRMRQESSTALSTLRWIASAEPCSYEWLRDTKFGAYLPNAITPTTKSISPF